MILETQRLLFRRLLPQDLDDLYALYADPEIRRYYPEGVLTYEETRQELEWFLNGHPAHPELGLWATIHKATGRFIGRCGLLPLEIDGRQEVEVAYLIAKEFWGQGLATEATRAIAEYAFERLGLERLISLVTPGNTASQRVAEKTGMHLERAVDGINGDGYPTLIYAMEREAEARISP